MTPDERYNRDVQFRHLVDSLYLQLREAHYTPTEIREAAMLAQIHYENLHPRMPWVYDPTAVDPMTWITPSSSWEPGCGKF